MSTNCGPLGMKGDIEPSDGRAALTDRSWAQICHSTGDDDATDVDFEKLAKDPDMKIKINKIRVISCLTAYIMVFIKHKPHFQPNLAYANLLTNKFDEVRRPPPDPQQASELLSV